LMFPTCRNFQYVVGEVGGQDGVGVHRRGEETLQPSVPPGSLSGFSHLLSPKFALGRTVAQEQTGSVTRWILVRVVDSR
jgi:hypothetical protein